MTRLETALVNGDRHSRRVAARMERLLREISPRPGARYLEIGSGNGATAVRVAQAFGLEVVGVDIDPKQVERATRASLGVNARFLVADATRLPFTYGSFDIVATSKTTHHVPAWRDALEEIARVLTHDGYLVFDDLVLPDWLARAGDLLAPGRAGYLSRRRLDDLLSGDFETIRSESAGIVYQGIFKRIAV